MLTLNLIAWVWILALFLTGCVVWGRLLNLLGLNWFLLLNRDNRVYIIALRLGLSELIDGRYHVSGRSLEFNIYALAIIILLCIWKAFIECLPQFKVCIGREGFWDPYDPSLLSALPPDVVTEALSEPWEVGGTMKGRELCSSQSRPPCALQDHRRNRFWEFSQSKSGTRK